MEENIQNPSTATVTAQQLSEDIDSCCSTPYVSAPSSPGRGTTQLGGGFYYSAPSSPVHFVTNLISVVPSHAAESSCSSFEFDFSARVAANGGDGAESPGSMCSADELFLNGQIRPMKLSTHLERRQNLPPFLGCDEVEQSGVDDAKLSDEVDGKFVRGRDLRFRTGSRRTRSMSPLRTMSFEWNEDEDKAEEREIEECKHVDETTPSASASESSSRSSSVGRSSKKWDFLKEFLYRSKSEGRNNSHKFWGSLSFSPSKDKKIPSIASNNLPSPEISNKDTKKKEVKKRPVNGVGKRRVPPSPHELHYAAKRAQAEEMKKRTFLPYRQGLLGCLGFSSKSYSAMNGLARALNPVSSR